MFRKFLWLEWKSFIRSSSLATNMILKILVIIGKVNMAFLAIIMGTGIYFLAQEAGLDPVTTVNKYLVYYLIADLVIRVMFQSIPVVNIRPLLPMPVKRRTVVNFVFAKTFLSIFTLLPAFIFIPFSIVLMFHGADPANVLPWLASVWAMAYISNLLNLLLDGKSTLLTVFIAFLVIFGALQYYSLFDITLYTGPAFMSLYTTGYLVVIPLAVLAGVWVYTFRFFSNAMYLDTGLKGKHTEATTENLTWLNKYGIMGTFLKNDIKLIKRNKRARTTAMQGIFLFLYGIFLISGLMEQYNSTGWKLIGALTITNGFMFTFGQLVPSWDSAYYPLMMSQNIKYREYISAKWWLIVVATAVTTLLSFVSLFFGIQMFLLVMACAVYNIGVNSHIALLGGAFIKTPIDLTTTQQAGGKKAFNLKSVLLILPKIVLPVALYYLGNFISQGIGTALIAIAGLLGFAFKEMVFKAIEKVYVSEKYTTIDAYKQKN